MPAVSLYIPAIVKIVLIVIVVILLLTESSKGSFPKCVGKLIPVYIVAIFQLLTVGPKYFLVSVYDLLGYLVVSHVFLYLFYEQKYSLALRLLKSAIIIYLITAITTIVGNTIFPESSRIMSTGMAEQKAMYDFYRGYNIGSFGFIYEIVLLVGILPYLFKNRNIPRWITISLYAVALYCAYITQFTIATLCVVGIGGFFFLGNLRNTKKVVGYVLAFLVISLLILPTVAQSVTNMLGDDSIIGSRVAELGNIYSESGVDEASDAGERQSLYLQSFNAFLESPLTGTGKGGGGHSFILDTMAKYGLLGILMLWIMLRSIYRIYIRPFRNSAFYGYLLLSYLMYLLLIFVNPAPLFMSISFLMPLISCVLDKSNDNLIKKVKI